MANYVYVLSNHDITIPEHLARCVETAGGDLHALVARLAAAGHHNLYIDGGVTIQSFLTEDLIDHLIITRVPVLLGDGIPLFSKLPQRMGFKHIKTTIYNDSLVKSHYARQREPPGDTTRAGLLVDVLEEMNGDGMG